MRAVEPGRLTSLLMISLVVGGLGACGGEGRRPASSETPAETPTETPRCSAIGGDGFDPCRQVSALANIFGAGREGSLAPAPGGGGGGVLPPFWELPAGSARIVTFPSITGQVRPVIGGSSFNGPEGAGQGPTDVESYGGISGIIHRNNKMFLVGVFLTDAEPSDPAPPRLDFTDREQFDVLAPRIGQTFLIGDGAGRSFRVPSTATRLFVGFADAYLFRGPPGWYGNNEGELIVTVDVATS